MCNCVSYCGVETTQLGLIKSSSFRSRDARELRVNIRSAFTIFFDFRDSDI